MRDLHNLSLDGASRFPSDLNRDRLDYLNYNSVGSGFNEMVGELMNELFFLSSHFLPGLFGPTVAYWSSRKVSLILMNRTFSKFFQLFVGLIVLLLVSAFSAISILLISFKSYEYLTGQPVGDDPGPVGVVFIGIPLWLLATAVSSIILTISIWKSPKGSRVRVDLVS